MMPSIHSRRPAWLVAGAASTAAIATFFVVLAVLSLVSGHGQFSWQVASMLLVWALLGFVTAWGLWARQPWSRGAIVATGLLHLFAFGQMIPTAPVAAVGAALAVVSVVAGALPSTREELRRGR